MCSSDLELPIKLPRHSFPKELYQMNWFIFIILIYIAREIIPKSFWYVDAIPSSDDFSVAASTRAYHANNGRDERRPGKVMTSTNEQDKLT